MLGAARELARRQWRLALCLGIFALLALPAWPATVDDVYITLTYARHWAETGVLEWTTGERVEGYSNFLFLAVMALAARLGGDADLLAQLLALAAGGCMVAWVEHKAPRDGGGLLLALAVAAWAPLNHWSAIGLETTSYAVLLVAGWVLYARMRWGAALFLLMLSALTRPEGILHLVVAALVGATTERRREWREAVAVAALFTAYHLARYTWFGAWIPTPFLVKVAPVGLTRYGLAQLLGDLASASGVLAALLASARARVRYAVFALIPLLLQATTLIRASGDWMGWGRLVLPGMLATVALFLEHSRPRGAARPALALVAVAVLATSLLEPRGYGTVDLRIRDLAAVARSFGHLRHGLDTPVAEDVAFAVDEVPDGAWALVVDTGILGDVPGINVLDARGLTHRPAAEATAANASEAWMRARIADPTTRPAFLRLANWESEQHPEYPEWLVGPYQLRADLKYGGGSIRWYADTNVRPSPERREHRWDTMLRRHPSQPFLWWHAALSAMADGSRSRALDIAGRARSRWPAMSVFRDSPASLSFIRGTRALEWTDRGFTLAPGETLTSAPVPGGRLEAAGGAVRVADPCSTTSEAEEMVLPSCEPRQLVVSNPQPDTVFVRLHPTAER